MSGSPAVLTPDGFFNKHQAIQADQNKLQDAAVHHQVEQAFEQRAGQRTEVPVVVMGERDHEQREGEAAQKVSQSQVEEPDGGDRAGHAEPRHPHHHSITRDSQEDHEAVEDQGYYLDGLNLRDQGVRTKVYYQRIIIWVIYLVNNPVRQGVICNIHGSLKLQVGKKHYKQ